MSAAETIQAAIEKLEDLQAGATPGRWSYYFEPWGDIMSEQEPGLGVETTVASEMSDFDGNLVVTLHRTIDAQLAILRVGINEISPHDDTTELITEAAFRLARAILGQES